MTIRDLLGLKEGESILAESHILSRDALNNGFSLIEEIGVRNVAITAVTVKYI